eukprot:g32088.t1
MWVSWGDFCQKGPDGWGGHLHYLKTSSEKSLKILNSFELCLEPTHDPSLPIVDRLHRREHLPEYIISLMKKIRTYLGWPDGSGGICVCDVMASCNGTGTSDVSLHQACRVSSKSDWKCQRCNTEIPICHRKIKVKWVANKKKVTFPEKLLSQCLPCRFNRFVEFMREKEASKSLENPNYSGAQSTSFLEQPSPTTYPQPSQAYVSLGVFIEVYILFQLNRNMNVLKIPIGSMEKE